MPDAEGVLLSAEPARRGLGAPGQTDLLSFVLSARRRVVPMGAVEQARAVAYQFLRWRASRLVDELHVYNPASGDVDGIETLLRWAARLKAELIRQELALALETLEKGTGKPLDELAPDHAGVLARELLEKVGEAVDHFDPFKAARAGGRLAGPVALAVQKLAVRVVRDRQAQPAPRPTGRLSARVAFDDWTLGVCPWQGWLEPDRRVRRFAGAGGPDAAAVLASRFGWSDAAPRTIEQTAADLSISTIAVVKLERRGIQAALAACREPAASPEAAATAH
jgi:hypothetical protein